MLGMYISLACTDGPGWFDLSPVQALLACSIHLQQLLAPDLTI